MSPTPGPIATDHDGLAARLAALPRMGLGRFPTPLEPWSELAAELGLGSLWVKREDVSAEQLGGNKLRGLEHLLGRAHADGLRRLVAWGPVGSNWCLAAPLFARQAGFECQLLLLESAWMERPLSQLEREQLHRRARLALEQASGGRVLRLPGFALALLRARLDPGRLLLPPGGSSPVAALGHLEALLELQRQQRELGLPAAQSVYVAFGSGATAAGLAAGCALRAPDSEIVAVRVAPRVVSNRWSCLRLARGCLRELGLGSARSTLGRVLRVEHGHAGRGYRWPTRGAREAVELARGLPGGRLDLTYTGKTLAALLADARSGRLRGRHVVFWQTLGSQPLPV